MRDLRIKERILPKNVIPIFSQFCIALVLFAIAAIRATPFNGHEHYSGGVASSHASVQLTSHDDHHEGAHHGRRHGHDGHHDSHSEYDFKYGVKDHKTGDVKEASESRHGHKVTGHYELIDADGHKRTVHYTADKHNGFQATVHREKLYDHHQVAVEQPGHGHGHGSGYGGRHVELEDYFAQSGHGLDHGGHGSDSHTSGYSLKQEHGSRHGHGI
ncbi:histidine-rich glycoprotein [Drosophila guanche]|uniref:histidine-rich glycoprotein n=1 Tax=Drosophila guanche TaxID=7266 RepID=UPI001470D501|nr:histidine-rich glycoprotein [Drosophila guanche]